jgi:hypothetical protein
MNWAFSNPKCIIIIIIIITIIVIILLQLCVHPVAVDLTLIQTRRVYT